jgi:GntR family transcriptional repressor for pyruvate dehydrogenase complex
MATLPSKASFADITPLERERRLYERVAEKMLSLIRDGVWQVGERLPSERELAQGFGVSRTVVREAVKVLEARGVLESATGSGVYVRQADSGIVSRSLQTYLQLSDATDVEMQIIDLRRALETGIAALAAQRATPEQLQALRNICQEMRRQDGAAQMLAELDFQFHLSLARATRNDLFEMLLTPLMEQLHDYYLVVWAGYGERPLEIVFEQHERLLDAVEARDSEAAREAMALHLAYSREVMKRQLDSSDGGAEHD